MLSRAARLAPVLVGVVLALQTSAPAPAFAGRTAACREPPFAVPTETQKAVDAAVDARVVATGSGGVSAGVSTKTSFDTTLLSQDAVGRSWAEYTLCLKLAKHLISQDLHDELLRSLFSLPAATPTATAQISVAPAPQSSPAPAARDLVGSWQVTSLFTWSSCPPPFDAVGSDAYNWLLNIDAQQRVSVTVIGNTAFPEMTGTYSDGVLTLTGERYNGVPEPTDYLATGSGHNLIAVVPHATVRVTANKGSLVGMREVAVVAGPFQDDDGAEGSQGSSGAAAGGDDPASPAWSPEVYAQTLYYQPCTIHYEVRGTRSR